MLARHVGMTGARRKAPWMAGVVAQWPGRPGHYTKPRIFLSDLLQFPARAGLINSGRKMLCQQLQRFIDRNAKMLGDLFNLIASECGAELLGCYLRIGTIAQPGFDLVTQPGLLKLVDNALQVTKVGFGQ